MVALAVDLLVVVAFSVAAAQASAAASEVVVHAVEKLLCETGAVAVDLLRVAVVVVAAVTCASSGCAVSDHLWVLVPIELLCREIEK